MIVKVFADGVFGIACICGIHIQKMLYVSEKSNRFNVKASALGVIGTDRIMAYTVHADVCIY